MDVCEAYARRWAKKEDVELDTLSEWIKSIDDVLKRRIQRLKHSINTRHESIFSDPDVVTELSRLHENFVIVGHLVLSHLGLVFVLILRPFFPELAVSTDLLSFEHPSVLLFCLPADKASYNYTFVCKRYYVDVLIEELGLHLLPGNPTYNLTDFSASEVLDNHKSVLTSFGIQTTDEELDLPYIYWIPKMHKIPINTDSLWVPRSVRPSLYPFYSQNCLHILSKVFRSTAKHPTPEVGSIRCGS